MQYFHFSQAGKATITGEINTTTISKVEITVVNTRVDKVAGVVAVTGEDRITTVAAVVVEVAVTVDTGVKIRLNSHCLYNTNIIKWNTNLVGKPNLCSNLIQDCYQRSLVSVRKLLRFFELK